MRAIETGLVLEFALEIEQVTLVVVEAEYAFATQVEEHLDEGFADRSGSAGDGNGGARIKLLEIQERSFSGFVAPGQPSTRCNRTGANAKCKDDLSMPDRGDGRWQRPQSAASFSRML